jgi:hypothetical protein
MSEPAMARVKKRVPDDSLHAHRSSEISAAGGKVLGGINVMIL